MFNFDDNSSCFLVISPTLFSKLTLSNNSFRNTIRMSNGLDPDQESVLIWVQTVCKGLQKMTKVIASKEGVKTCHTKCFFPYALNFFLVLPLIKLWCYQVVINEVKSSETMGKVDIKTEYNVSYYRQYPFLNLPKVIKLFHA